MILDLSGIGLGLTRKINPAFDFSCYKSMFGFGRKVFVTVDFVESRLRTKPVSIITTTTEIENKMEVFSLSLSIFRD